MHDFLVKKVLSSNIENDLQKIGFDKSYIHKAKDKFNYVNLKIFDLNCAQANILKQTALSAGADCATHREVITGKIEKSDVILGGSISQLQKIALKLEFQPFGLKDLGEKIKFQCRNINADLHETPAKIVGILNITPDSFSDGGKYFDLDSALKHFDELVKDGADVIDIGAESTRPNFETVDAQTQLKRLTPLLKEIKSTVPVSIDTRSAEVAQKCIELGANIINDVSGFDFDPKMINVISNNPHVKIIIQHWRDYSGMDDLYKILEEKVKLALSKGIDKENIIIDPGIGFGKNRVQNFEILNNHQELRTLDCPIMIGISRKSLLDMPDASNEEKDLYTLALNAQLISSGVDYIRVHNVKIHKNYINMLQRH